MYLRFAAMPLLILFEPLTEHICLGPLTSLAAQYLFNIPFYIFIPVHMVSWCIMDYILSAVIEVNIELIVMLKNELKLVNYYYNDYILLVNC